MLHPCAALVVGYVAGIIVARCGRGRGRGDGGGLAVRFPLLTMSLLAAPDPCAQNSVSPDDKALTFCVTDHPSSQ